jgi:D-sedoheptulose 7-phosphate isomerase
MTFSRSFVMEIKSILDQLDLDSVEAAVNLLASVRDRQGRLFILGVGGSAANASHAVNDFRKISGIEAYAPTDNVSELSARTNDEGWATTFESWLRVSRLSERDAVLVLSVGGGDLERNVSPNIVNALNLARSVRASIIAIVGRDGGYTAKVADACVRIPVVNAAHITPHSEAFQGIVWHLMVSHPALKAAQTKWEAAAAVSEH